MSNSIEILLVDDHALLRRGMRLLLDDEAGIEVVGEAANGEEAISQVKALQPDIVIIDISMPVLNGIDATRKIVASWPASRVIALSIHSGKRFVDDMLNAGASGYMLKESVPEELILGIRAVHRGEMYLSSSVAGTVLSAYVKSIQGQQQADNPADILRSKLHMPQITPDTVQRQRLFDRLDSGKVRPLTLVSAAAGYGKSILISSWLKESDWPGAWISLDENDGEVGLFLKYITTAIRDIFPDSCENSHALTMAEKLPAVAEVTACLSNDFEAIDQPFVLVLDDYQNISMESSVNDLLDQLLSHTPIPLHIVIITRRDPALSLVPLRARNQVTEIRTDDLRFSLPEARLLLETSASFAGSQIALDNVQEEMEGWAAGLRLVSLALRHTEDQDNFLMNLRGGIQKTREYLVQEVVAMQAPALRSPLLRCAILDQFSRPLCNAVCGSEDSHGTDPFDGDTFINSLLKENLFTMGIDSQGIWYRYHQLFRQLLQQELHRTTSTDEIASLHLKASEWFEKENQMERAFHHVQASNDLDMIAQFVVRNWRVLVDRDQWYILRKWLSHLPDSIVNAQPQLVIASAWMHYHRMDTEQLQSTLSRIEEFVNTGRTMQEFSGEIQLFRGSFELFNNDSAAALHSFENALLEIPESNYSLRGDTEVLFALAGQMQGNLAQVSTKLNSWLNDRRQPLPLRTTRLLMTHTLLRIVAGDLVQAEQYIQKHRDIAMSQNLENALAWCDYLQGYIYLQQGKLKSAIDYLEKAGFRKHCHFTRAAICALNCLSLAQEMLGESEAAAATLKTLHDFVAEYDPSMQLVADSFEARLALLQVSPAVVAQWLQTSTPVSPGVMLLWLEAPCLTRCRALLTSGSDNDLRVAVERLREYAELNKSQHNVIQSIGIHVLLAIASDKQGQVEDAFTHLTKALSSGQPGNVVFPFLESGEPLVSLLKRLPDQHENASFAERIISMYDELSKLRENRKSTNGTAKITVSTLTNRENEILALLVDQLQNKEIAAKLFVSPETVKYHLKHLYQKLNVSNRRQAAAKGASILAGTTSANT